MITNPSGANPACQEPPLLAGRVRFWFAKMRGKGSMLDEGDGAKLGDGERH